MAGSTPRANVLLVDDSTTWAEAIGQGLRQEGYDVTVVYDGMAAVDKIRASAPDILITDFFLANLDGGKLCQLAKSVRKDAAPIITVILTGGADRHLARVPSTYADAVIAKNTPAIVLSDLHRVLGQLRHSLPAPRPYRDAIGHERLHPRVLSNKLHRLKQYLDALHEGIGDAVMGIDHQKRVHFLNAMAIELLGIDEADAIARPAPEVLGLDEAHPLMVELNNALVDGGPPSRPLSMEIRGSVLRVTVTGLESPDGRNSVILIARDLTDIEAADQERQTLNARLNEADKMASLGQLAASISHEINNPLAALLPNLQAIEEDFSRLRQPLESAAASDPSLAQTIQEFPEILADSREAAERIRSIVGDMRLFAHPTGSKGESLQVEDVVESALSLASNEIRFKAKVVREYGKTRPIVVDRNKLSQAFLNILLNGAQAIDGKTPGGDWIRVETSERDDGVVISISNSGPHIPRSVLNRIFEPFFTTKEQGRGVGLGLAIAYETLRRHGGNVDVESSEGTPTTFTIWLPHDTGLGLQAQDGSDRVTETPPGRILVVDDERIVRNSLRRLLERHYEVQVASSGAQAFEILLSDDPVDLVLCDLIMPGMTGMELYDRVRAHQPKLADRFVFITGGTSSIEARDFLANVRNPRAYKPIDIRELKALVRSCLRRLADRKAD